MKLPIYDNENSILRQYNDNTYEYIYVCLHLILTISEGALSLGTSSDKELCRGPHFYLCRLFIGIASFSNNGAEEHVYRI